MKTTIRKGTIVKYESEQINKDWGLYFEVWEKRGDFVRLCSLEKPMFGVIACVPCENIKIANM
jgi:hypothetical protein